MDLFIIGNGFDLAHGLKTQYWNFREFLKWRDLDFLIRFETGYYLDSEAREDVLKDVLWERFEEKIAYGIDTKIYEFATTVEYGLEGGDIFIEDDLGGFMQKEFGYIDMLSQYLKQWIQTIKIRDLKPITSRILPELDAHYINFNYTGVLERVYKIDSSRITHIHGSLRINDPNPVIGHSAYETIQEYERKLQGAWSLEKEKERCGARAVIRYYRQTLKDVRILAERVLDLCDVPLNNIYVIGSSIGETDQYYFGLIDEMTGKDKKWQLFYHNPEKNKERISKLIKCGIDIDRILLYPEEEFFDMNNIGAH